MISTFEKLLTASGRNELTENACHVLLGLARTPPWDGSEIQRTLASDTVRFSTGQTINGVCIYEVVTRWLKVEIPVFGQNILFRHEVIRDRYLETEAVTRTRFPTVAFCSTQPDEAIRHMAMSYLMDLVELAPALNLRERAAIVELTHAGDFGEADVLRAACAIEPGDLQLLRAFMDPNSRDAVACELHAAADAELQQWKVRTGGTMEGEVRELLKEMNWAEKDGGTARATREEVRLSRALTRLSAADPLGAALLYAQYVPNGSTLTHPAIAFSDHHWRSFSRTITDLLANRTPLETRLTLSEDRTPVGAKAIALLQLYALHGDDYELEGLTGKAEFLGTLEAAQRLSGWAPVADGAASRAAAEFLRTQDELRQRWEAGDASTREQVMDECEKGIAQLGATESTTVPLRAAVREFIQRRGSIGTLFLRARAHAELSRAFGQI